MRNTSLLFKPPSVWFLWQTKLTNIIGKVSDKKFQKRRLSSKKQKTKKTFIHDLLSVHTISMKNKKTRNSRRERRRIITIVEILYW